MDNIVTIIITSLTIALGALIIIARLRSKSIKELGNPSTAAARGEIMVLAIVMIIGGVIAIMKEL